MKQAHVVGRFLAVLADSKLDPDETPEQVPLTGTVTFTPQVTAILDTSVVPPATVLPAPVVCTLDADGDVSYEGSKGVTVIATEDPAANPTNWTYTVSFDLAQGKRRVSYASYAISLPPDVTTDLTLVARVPSSTGVGLTRGIGVESIDAQDGALVFQLTDRSVQTVSIDGALVTSVNGLAGDATVGDLRADELAVEDSPTRTVLDAQYAARSAHEALAAEVSTFATEVDELITTEVTALQGSIVDTTADVLVEAQTYADEKLTAEVQRSDSTYAPANVLDNAVVSVNGQRGAVSIPISDDTTITAIAKNSASQLRTEIKAITDGQVTEPLSKKLDKTEAASTYATSASVTTELELRVNPLVDQRIASDSTVSDAAAAAVANELAGGITDEIVTVIDSKTASGDIPMGGTIAAVEDVAFAVTDEDGRRTWLEVAMDGGLTQHSKDIIAPAVEAPVAAAVGISSYDHAVSEVAFAVTDEDGRRTDIEVGLDGRFTDRVVTELSQRIIGSSSVKSNKIVCSGDSMTGSGYPSYLATNTGWSVVNMGVGGENVSTISARMGGRPALVTTETGYIPASGTVKIFLETDDKFDPRGLYPLLQQSGGMNPARIAGVEGTVAVVNKDDAATRYYTFTRAAAGEQVRINYPTALVTAAMRDHRDGIHVMWWGTNDSSLPSGSDVTHIIARQRALIEHIKGVGVEKQWLVIGFSISSANWRAPSVPLWRNAFGRRFIDIGHYLSSPAAMEDAGLTPTQADLDNMALGNIPAPLKADSTHLNATGNNLVAKQVEKRIKEMGWL